MKGISSGIMRKTNTPVNYRNTEKFTYDQWMITRDRYLDWLSGFLCDKKEDPLFNWRGFNLWYITLPAKKDVEADKDWFKKIHTRIHGYEEPASVAAMPVYLFVLKFLGLFIFDLLKLVLSKWVISRSNVKSGKADVYFHSLSSNLQKNGDMGFDRNFKYAPLSDVDFEQQAAYLVFIAVGKNDIRHFLKYTEETCQKLVSLNRNVILLNRFISIRTIIATHWRIFRSWIRFRKELKKEYFQNSFFINNISCADILINEIEKSFLGEIQWSLLYGISFEKWVRKEKLDHAVPIVTYGETLSTIRPVYFFSKKANPGITFFSIQHSTNNRNKMGLYHRSSEFWLGNEGNLINLQMVPDYYLLQGEQFLEIVNEFYPKNRTCIIGCLKYDDLVISDDLNARQTKVLERICGKTRPIMLIAPSVNDIGTILSLFSINNVCEGWRVLLCPHPAISKMAIEELVKQVKTDIEIEVIYDLKTVDLFTVVNLVVCGYSASAYEAVMHSVPAIQYDDLSSIPLVEPILEIPFFSSKDEFWSWYKKNEEVLRSEGKSNNDKTITERFFYKNDGKAKGRLWEFVLKHKL